MTLHVVGVRHHSPACARLVEHTIRRTKPLFVLIEGPSDMNPRMGELMLPHTLPIALFTYRQDVAGASRGTWSPFCEYSPEWVALRAARDAEAKPLFIDLPAWDPAFEGEENRYSDKQLRHSDRIGDLAVALGFEDIDALWDHLFEQPLDEEALARDLERYFEQLRGDEAGGARDGPREAFMSRFVAWAIAEAGERDVVVVCGGYHKPAIERGWREAPVARPEIPSPSPDEARIGTYLVPFSFRRLDSFSGYAAGMPSPAFHQAVWEKGHAHAAESMLFEAVTHLRKKKRRVSPADVIAASTLAHGLQALRGHTSLSRIDVLDGLAGALVKDALAAPLPWTRRGALSSRTEPLLVEILSSFSGHRIGALAPGTPQPPLVHDAMAELERVGVPFTRDVRRVTAPLTTPAGAAQSAVLHRLRLLGIPGFNRTRAPSFARAHTDLTEEWSVVHALEAEPALIESALYGATLEGAATAKLDERCRGASDVRVLAETLFDAALAGLGSLTQRALDDIRRVVAHEPSFDALGSAMTTMLSLQRGDQLLGARVRMELREVIVACFDRGLWLFEGIQGGAAPLDVAQVRAVVALRDAARARDEGLGVDVARARAVCERRTKDAEAPPGLRGAALGFLWSTTDLGLGPQGASEERAVAMLRAVARPETFGDFLGGLFALAREEVVQARRLVGTIDGCVAGFLREDFLIALPALRQAFAFFPPRERLMIAESILELGGEGGADPRELVRARVDADLFATGALLDRDAAALAQRYGLADDDEGAP